MRCCIECFASEYIKPIIQSFSVEKGNCDFCHTSAVTLCDPRELVNYFRGILDLYITVSGAQDLGYNLDELSNSTGLIYDRLLADFGVLIFSSRVTSEIQPLIAAIFEDNEQDYYLIFNEFIILEHLCNYAAYEDYHKLALTWGNFVEEIKSKNRFHLSTKIDLKIIERLLSNHVKVYRPGKKFYRGRVSDILGFPKEKMGNPPAFAATAGRANPAGISYLYVAESIDTTLHETRASLYDYVSIGEFTVKEEISVINLREPHLYDPIFLAENEKLRDFMLNLPFLTILEKELSKPVRRTDNQLDYLPTQYLSEFIKSLGYDGIEYRSSLNPTGYNVAIFHPEKLDCTKAYVHEIHKVDFHHAKLILE
jgi:hypothetical protein